jgi:hypothetical protein
MFLGDDAGGLVLTAEGLVVVVVVVVVVVFPIIPTK